MSDPTPTPKPKKTKEEILKALREMQIDPADLAQVVAADPACTTCYTLYGGGSGGSADQ
jgi:DNA-directed RNA polymerase subunit H (RpoH/RPB5)